MIETVDYYIYEDSFIFKPYFNGFINDYINIISNYKKLIFSNYNEPKLCVKANNNYIANYHDKHKSSYFNKPLSDSLNNLTQLQQLTFGDCFNHPLSDSLNNQIQLQKLTFIILINH